MSPPRAMAVALMLIEMGVIEVRADGTVWKLRNLIRMPLPAPRRLETRTKRGYLAVRVNWSGRAYRFEITLPEGVEDDPALAAALLEVERQDKPGSVFGQVLWRDGELVFKGAHFSHDHALKIQRAINGEVV